MLSQTGEHALRACLFLARQPGAGEEGGAFIPADAIASAVGAPRNYLSKTLGILAGEGIVSSLRGPQGGFRLAVAPGALTIAAVVASFEPSGRNPICLLGGRPCSDIEPCRAHHTWTLLRAQAQAGLERTTIADLLAGTSPDGTGAPPPDHRRPAARGWIGAPGP